MRTRVVVSAYVEAPPRRVFSLFAKPTEHFRWSGGLQYSSATVLQTGTNYETRHVMLGQEIKGRNVVLAMSPDNLFEIMNTTGPIAYHVTYSLIKTGSGTTVTCNTDIESRHVAFNLAAPVFEMMVEAQLQRDLDSIKDAAEADLLADQT
jgi:uncharacterized protein YndB with AHSA1/START domain